MIDEYGIFTLIGDTITQIYITLENIEFFGISVMAMMLTGFIISLIIPFLGIIIMPSIGGSRWSSRGGNKGEKAKEPEGGTGRYAIENRKRMQQNDD